MLAYIIRRLLLIPITLTGIFMTSFLLINFAPGGPLEALIAEMQGISTDLGDRMIGSDGDVGEANTENTDGSVGKSVNPSRNSFMASLPSPLTSLSPRKSS